ncbi:MAG: hypothetical protein LBP69_10690 [Treponema sp.]|jgi:hypothetical protein|nr:hypothetical protein [Treponema sp.]
MKNKLVSLIVCCVLGFGLSLTSCDNSTSGTKPVISSIFTSGSEQDLEDRKETTTFAPGQQFYLAVVVFDPDLDIVAIRMTLTQVGGSLEEVNDNISSPYIDTRFSFEFTFNPGTGSEGQWIISVEVFDSKGNKSDPASCMVTVK